MTTYCKNCGKEIILDAFPQNKKKPYHHKLTGRFYCDILGNENYLSHAEPSDTKGDDK